MANAMHSDVYRHMEERLDALKERMINLIPFDMTHLECLDLVADPEHIPILRDASKYASITAAVEWMALGVPHTIDGVSGCRVSRQMRTHEER